MGSDSPQFTRAKGFTLISLLLMLAYGSVIASNDSNKSEAIGDSAVGATVKSNPVQHSEPPNIIVVLVDDMGFSDIGAFGSEIDTPNLDQLANEGMRFTNLYTTARCSPTRASLLTGRYAQSTGIGHLDRDFGYPGYRGFINDQSITMAEMLSREGYRTILSGKWHVGRNREHWPDQRGFDRFYGIPAGGGVYFYPTPFLERDIYRNGEHIEPKDKNYYTTNAFTDEAISYIAEAKRDEKPFFLYLAYVAPHFPLQAPEQDIQKYLGKYGANYAEIRQARFEKQKRLGIIPAETMLSEPYTTRNDSVQIADRKMAVYAAQIDVLDRNIGKLQKSLQELELLDNTVIFFLSDNGAVSKNQYKNNKHGVTGPIGSRNSFYSYGKAWANVSNTPYREYKSYSHEGGIISPLIVHWPNGIAEKGALSREPLHVIDILPTVATLTGTIYPESYNGNTLDAVDGVDFSALLEGERFDNDRTLFWEHEGNKAVRKGDYKAVLKHGGEWELYDLSKDITELNNIAPAKPTLLAELIRQYEVWARRNHVLPWPVVDDPYAGKM